MSTNAVVPSPNTLAELPVKTETVDYAIIAELKDDGTVNKFSLTTSEKQVEEIEKPDYKGKNQIARKVSVSKPIVGTLDGFSSLFPDVKDQVAIINMGISKNFDRTVRKNLLETDDAGQQLTYAFPDGVIDGTPFIQDVTIRQKMSDEEAAVKALSKIGGLTPDQIAAIMAQVKAAQASA